MAKNKSLRLPSFNSLDKLVEFFDTQDMGEYWDYLPEVHADVEIRTRTHLFAIDEELVGKLTAIAEAKRLSSQTLVNSWLREKISEQAERP